jgi:hypothetical protein
VQSQAPRRAPNAIHETAKCGVEILDLTPRPIAPVHAQSLMQALSNNVTILMLTVDEVFQGAQEHLANLTGTFGNGGAIRFNQREKCDVRFWHKADISCSTY